jgi:hypothetical protein
MANQTAANVKASFKVQSGIGVPASGSGATGLKVNPTQAMTLNKAIIANPTIRYDGQTSLGRHGTRSGSLSYKLPLSVGTVYSLIEAALRGTSKATFDITEASTLGGSAAATSITTTTNTIVMAAGSNLLQGAQKGMVCKLTGHSTAANNGKWFPVVDVSALVVTLPAGSLTLNAVADTAFTLTFAKSVINGATPVERYFTFEEYMQDVDLSVLGTDFKVTKLEINAQPNQNVEVTISGMGLDIVPQTIGTSPVLTATYTTTKPLVMADGLIRVGGVTYGAAITGLSIVWDLGGEVTPGLSQTCLDVFLGNGKISGTMTFIRSDLGFLTAFRNETTADLFVVFSENTSDPKNFEAVYIGNLTYSGNSVSLASTGPMSESVPWNGGIDESGGGAASTSLLWSSSSA